MSFKRPSGIVVHMKDGPLMLLDRARDPKRPVLLNLLGQHLFLGPATPRETLLSNSDSEMGRQYKMMCVCKEETQMPPSRDQWKDL